MLNLMRSCGHDGTHVLNLPPTPLADQFMTEPDSHAPAPRHALGLRHCSTCTMVENVTFVDDDVLFGKDYAFFSGSSPALVNYFGLYADWLKQNFTDQLRHGIVEIASNDGTLLSHFKNNTHLGIDPAGPPSRSASDKGLNVENAPFTHRLAVTLPQNQLVVANNVVAHVANLTDFLAGVAFIVGNSGRAVLEFQYLPDLLLGNQFDLVYHEHRRFLSLTALQHSIKPHGLAIVDAMLTPTQGGSVRVVLAPSYAGIQKTTRAARLMDGEFDLYDVNTLRSFAVRVAHITTRLEMMMEELATEGYDIGLYGAPAKATTLVHAAGIAKHINYAVDLTDYKIGKYMPGTDIKIVTPSEENWREDKADVYLLGIPNYLGSVIRRERSFMVRGGKFLLPLPKPVIL
jgi:hypothetical protein